MITNADRSCGRCQVCMGLTCQRLATARPDSVIHGLNLKEMTINDQQ